MVLDLLKPGGMALALATGMVPSFWLLPPPANPLPLSGTATMFFTGIDKLIAFIFLNNSLPGFMSFQTASLKNQFNILAVGEPCHGVAIVNKPFTLRVSL